MRLKKTNRGFTLAEVLITLGIIGVVAAMTLPAVINNTKNKELETAFRKSYSLLTQVTQRVVNDDFGGSLDETSSYKLTKYYKKYYKNATICSGYNTNNGCPNVNYPNFCTFMESNYKTYNGTSKPGCIGNDALSNTVDNTTMFFDFATEVEGEIGSPVYRKIIIAIDVNGWQKRPNRWGHDVFLFQINNKGKVLPMGVDGTAFPVDDYCSETSLGQYNGYGCTVKAINDPNYFKNLPK